jgi:Bifunctional DNA primase/polymerase, N-terminal
MTGIFAAWQPAYAARNIPTFPVLISAETKRPAVRGYLKLGLDYSRQLATRFPANDAFGFAPGRRSKITVLDIDSSDERVRDHAFARHGEPAILVRTLSGHWHGWFKYAGEGRRIRPWPQHPVDVLGGGYVVAPPSRGAAGSYEFIVGGLDDLDRLTTLRSLDLPPPKSAGQRAPAHIPDGVRDDTVFRRLLHEAKSCDDFETLLDVGRTINMNCVPPLPDAQIVSKAKQVWHYETTGRNWVGRRARASTDREEILALSRNPAAALLLSLLRVSHPMPDKVFAIDQVETAKLLGWNRRTLCSCIQALIEAGRLTCVQRGARGHPHQYRLAVVRTG